MSVVSDLRAQTNQFLTYVTTTALQPVLGADLPIIGSALGGAATDLLLTNLRSTINGAFDSIGDTADKTPQQVAKLIANKLDGLLGGVVHASADKGVVTIDIKAHDSANLNANNFAIDVGGGGLGFDLKGGVSAGLDFDLNTKLTFNVSTATLSLVDTDDKLISVNLTGSLDNFIGGAKLGFLAIDVADKQTDDEIKLHGSVDYATPAFPGQPHTVSIANLSSDNLHALVGGTASVDFGVTAGLSTNLLPKISTDLVASYVLPDYDPAADGGTLTATPYLALNDITLDIGELLDFVGDVFGPLITRVFGAYPIAPLLNTLTAPIPLISEGSKDAGFFDILNVIDDDRINILDLAAAYLKATGASTEVIEAFSKAFSLIQALAEIKNAGDMGQIDLGSHVVLGTAPMNQLVQTLDAGASALDQLGNALDAYAANHPDAQPAKGDGLSGLASALSDILGDSGLKLPVLQLDTIVQLLMNGGDTSTPLDLITYDVPELAFTAQFHKFFPVIGPIGVAFDGEFHAGIDVNIGYDTAGLASGGTFDDGFYFTTTNVGYHEINDDGLFSYFAPAANVGASIDASAAVNVGIAEAGIGGGVSADLFAYLDGGDVPTGGKLRLSQLLAGEPCIFDPIIGEFGVRVRVYITVGISPFDYTKRYDLVKKTLADFTYDCPPPQLDPKGGLASFAVDEQSPNDLYINAGDRAEKRIINHIKGADTDEFFTVTQLESGAVQVNAFSISDINGHPDDPASDDGISPDRIVAHMGQGGDQMVLDENVVANAVLYGDDGDDLLAGGLAGDYLDGGNDGDRLLGRAGSDVLNGGSGNDVLEGGLGADQINGGSGFDQVTYENSAAGVTFKPGSQSGTFTGSGGEAEGDVITSIEQVTGSHFNDTLIGNPTERNILEGLDGVDLLKGGSAEDLLIGGGKADNLYGGDGNDTVSYLTSSGQVQVNLALGLFGTGKGGDAEGDKFYSIENVQGTAYSDNLTGNASDNKLLGWYGDDVIDGGAGKDQIFAGAGDDIVYGRGEGDLLNGDSDGGTTTGNFYRPDHDLLTYEKAASGVIVVLAQYKLNADGSVKSVSAGSAAQSNFAGFDSIGVNVVKITDPNNGSVSVFGNSTFEDLTGSLYGDKLYGDYQDNVIRGLDGADRLYGSNGDDTLIGGAGADRLIGDDGRDLADYSGSNNAVTVTLADGDAFGTGSGGDAQGDLLQNIEDLRGSNRADTLTGNSGDNRIDPGLARSGSGTKDMVDGGAGTDTLALDWSDGDIGQGIVGGFTLGAQTSGTFARKTANGSALLDSVSFANVERIEVHGTSKGDAINGGAGDDRIYGNDGADLIFTGIGFDKKTDGTPDYFKGGTSFDLVVAGAGNDGVAINTDVNGKLSGFGSLQFGFIDGGSGIDTLTASFALATTDIDLNGTDGSSEFDGANLKGVEGSAIYRFELLGTIATGFGNDTLTQIGRFNNVFATGFGRDQIDAGFGKDVVDGGLDFVYNNEVVLAANDPKRLNIVADDFSQVFSSDGDLLEIDYSDATAGITSSVTQVDTGYTLGRAQDSSARAIFTNNGYFQAGADRTDFSNIERLIVAGSKYADSIFGTDLTYGLNQRVGENLALAASDSARGDDALFGFNGNDVIFAGTGSDRVSGGNGDDVLLGTAYPTQRDIAPVDLGEIDTMSGGAGRDVFILGLDLAFYNDQVTVGQTANRTASTDNRAVIQDFEKGLDYLVLAAAPLGTTSRPPSFFYTTVEHDGNTFIYLKDGRSDAGKADPSRNELVAELEGVTGVNLNGGNILYYSHGQYLHGDGSAATPPPTLQGASAQIAHADAERAVLAPSSSDHSQAIYTADLSIAAAPQAPLSAAPVSWVKQTADPTQLRNALFGGNSVLNGGTLTVDGDSVAVGVFNNDPFGLGAGVVLSTGRVADLAGKNTIDGGHATLGTVDLNFTYVGSVTTDFGTSRVYRADLSHLGFDLKSIRLGDDSGGYGGGSGVASGFDIDAIKLSHDMVSSVSSTLAYQAIAGIDAFDFDLGSVEYDPGDIRSPTYGALSLAGTKNGLPLLDNATLNTIDGRVSLATGSLTLGDGGSVGFDLNQKVSTDGPLYLYVVEAGGSGEVLKTGLTASANRLEAPADLSTDLGTPGLDDDTTTLTYTFTPRTTDGSTPTQISFDVVFLSEEFAEFAEQGFNDKFKVLLNGVELARLSDGSYASIDTLYAAPAGPGASTSIYDLRTDTTSSDLIYNPVGTGPAANATRADGYSKVLHLTGDLLAGKNVLQIQVSDEGDAYLDSGILIRGGSFTTATRGGFTIEGGDRPVHEGESRTVNFGVDLPRGTTLTDPVTAIFTPAADIDLGRGAGVAITRTLDAEHPTGTFAYTVVSDGSTGNSRLETIDVQIRGLPGTTSVAPLVVDIDDSAIVTHYTIGNAPETYDRTDPGAWARAWSHEGLTITHTASLARGAYSDVTFTDRNPTTLSGGDIVAGDLGVSGNGGATTSVAQEIAGTEALRFSFESQSVSEISIDFAQFETGDRVRVQVYGADGALLSDQVTGDATYDVAGLNNAASVVVSAASGAFVLDSMDVTETLVGIAPGAFATSSDIGDRSMTPHMMVSHQPTYLEGHLVCLV